MSSRTRHRRCEGSHAFERLGRDSSLYLRSVQNDSNVISNVGERSHIICSLGGRCFAALSMDKQLAGDSSRQSLSERHRAHKGIYPISKRFFLPAVVRMKSCHSERMRGISILLMEEVFSLFLIEEVGIFATFCTMRKDGCVDTV